MRFHGDAATSAIDDAAVHYQSPSIIAAGADARSVSILATLINLSLAVVCIKAPALIEKAGLAKRGAVILAFLNLCAWVPLTLAFFLSQLGIAPGWFALLWFLNLVPGLLLSVQRDNWLSNLVAPGGLGRYLGQRLAIKSAFYLGGFCCLGYLLDRLGKDNLAGFAVVFTVAVAVALIDFIIFTFMSEKKTDTAASTETEPFSLREYFAELKEKKLDGFIIFTTFFYLTVGLSGPLYAVYMLTELHFSYLSYTLVIAAEFLARVVSAPFWGRYADKAGNIRVLGIVSRIIPFVPVAWLFWHDVAYLVFIQILSGTCWGAFDLCTQSYLYKVAPQPKKLRYIIYTRCLVLAFTALGGLAGAFCVNGIFPTFGSKILSVFWISGIFRALVVLYMMPKLVDLAVSFSKPCSPPEVNNEILRRVLAAKRGQFYRQPPAAQPAFTEHQKLEADASSELNRYAGARKWNTPAKSATVIPVAILVPKKVDPAMRLAHYREATANMVARKPEVVSHHRLQQNEVRLKLRYDLERQLKDLTRRAEAALSFHGLEANAARLKAHYQLDRQTETAAVLAGKSLEHHRIEENIERLKWRYKTGRQAAAGAARVTRMPDTARPERVAEPQKAKSSAGLYRDKTGWAKYVKDSMEAILREGQPRPVPVTASSYRLTGIPAGPRGRDLPLRRPYLAVP